MLPLLFAALLQPAQLPTPRQILEAEHARSDSGGVLQRAASSNSPTLQRLALRALGRLERNEFAAIVTAQTRATSALVRREAVNALGQMRAPVPFRQLLDVESDPIVRAAIFETIGRASPTDSIVELTLASGLAESSAVTRAGAARGLEAYVRHHARAARPRQATIEAIRTAFARDTASETRQLLLLSMNAAGVRDSVFFATALSDPNPQVRRLAVVGARHWVSDPAPMVRYQALRTAATCELATASLDDSSEHVALAAVDILGERKCSTVAIASQVKDGRTWRLRGRALVSLARVDPAEARRHLATFVVAPQWQSRAYAANAARLSGDSSTLDLLVNDRDPNVIAVALNSVEHAKRALGTMHAGLLLEAVAYLERAQATREALPELQRALQRVSTTGNVTYRDVRVAILDRISGITGDTSSLPMLRGMIADIDPEVARRAAQIISARTGTTVHPGVTKYRPAPLPSEPFIAALRGAHAEIRFRDLGVVRVELLTEEATVTVATFAQLADSGRFDGLTIHRIVPNFVIQGGSPGADEYDGLTSTFMRDELGFTRNERGTFGVSTRGRDTGDGQIYVNLVDNFRLDHDYTVFARVLDGMPIVDRIQEGDVIESVRIIRNPSGMRR